VPLEDRARFRLAVEQNGREIALLDGHRDTVYQRLGRDCRGGHVSRDTYRARFLVPLRPGEGAQQLAIRLAGGRTALLTPGTGVDVWPPDFETRIGLRHAPSPGARGRPAREPVKAAGVANLRLTRVPGFLALDLSALCNRPHGSVRVGGGDNASFKTWFADGEVRVEGVPFLVRRTGNDVLVSANNTQNVFEIGGFESSARALHLLVWGYNRPRLPAEIRIGYRDGATQVCKLPLSEWTDPPAPAAFDFANTVGGFRHAAIERKIIAVAHPEKRIVSIHSTSGTYGLVAITLESARGNKKTP
jgi:hypothetical protein